MNVRRGLLKRPKNEMIVNQFRLLPTTTPSSLLISSHIHLYPSSGHFSTVRQLTTVGFYLPNPSYTPDSSKSKPVEPKYVTKIEVQTARSLYMRKISHYAYAPCHLGLHWEWK
jgi:hypothetical protein